jgi:SEL1 protein
VEKGDTRAMELLGEIYARGAGVERNYTEAYKWLVLAANQQQYSAYNGLGYLYVKGYGVEQKNLTKVSLLLPLFLNMRSFASSFFFASFFSSI